MRMKVTRSVVPQTCQHLSLNENRDQCNIESAIVYATPVRYSGANDAYATPVRYSGTNDAALLWKYYNNIVDKSCIALGPPPPPPQRKRERNDDDDSTLTSFVCTMTDTHLALPMLLDPEDKAKETLSNDENCVSVADIIRARSYYTNDGCFKLLPRCSSKKPKNS